jgi:hypothetical protein
VLPSGVPLYARVYWQTGTAWQYSEIQFAAAPSAIAFTNPTAGQQNIDQTRMFTWSTSTSASGYLLEVGTTPGGFDLVDSGALPATQSSYLAPVLPTGRPLYARLYAVLADGYLQYQDITFTAAPSPVMMSYPQDGAQSVDPTHAFTWSTSASAEGYRLAVGTQAGGRDLFDSGQLPATQSSVNVPSLPAGTLLYASLYTQLGGQWQYEGISFTVASAGASLPSTASLIPFAPGNVWVTPLPSDVPLDSRSSAIVANLNQQILDNYGHAALNTSAYSAPIYTVAPN